MRRRLALIALAAVGIAAPLSAQVPRADGAHVSYRAFAPTGRVTAGAIVEFGPSFILESSRRLSGHVLSARVPVTARVAVVAQVPVAFREFDVTPEEDARYEEIVQSRGDQPTYTALSRRSPAFGLGNPLLGAELSVTDRVTVEAGVRVPVAGRRDGGLNAARFDPAYVVGLAADPLHEEAYATGAATLSAGVRHRRPVGRHVVLEGHFTSLFSVLSAEVARGPSDAVSRPASSRTNLAAVWDGSAEASAGPVMLGLGVSGRIDPDIGWTPERADPVGVGVSLGMSAGPVRPSVAYQRYLSGGRRAGAVSLRLDVPLR